MLNEVKHPLMIETNWVDRCLGDKGDFANARLLHRSRQASLPKLANARLGQDRTWTDLTGSGPRFARSYATPVFGEFWSI